MAGKNFFYKKLCSYDQLRVLIREKLRKKYILK